MISIIRAGLAGLNAAYHIDREYMALEKDSEVGGLCKSIQSLHFSVRAWKSSEDVHAHKKRTQIITNKNYIKKA